MRQRLRIDNGLRWRLPSPAGTRTQRPRGDLPVSSDPSMLPVGECRVIEREALEQFNIGCEADSYMGSLNQIVTEQRLFGKAAIQESCGRPATSYIALP